MDDAAANATLFANPSNCSTFYLCSQGTPVLIVCPDGLHFNEDLKVCDHPYRANCGLTTTPTPEFEPVTTKVVITKVVKEIISVQPSGDDVQTATRVSEEAIGATEAPGPLHKLVYEADGTPAAIDGADEYGLVGELGKVLNKATSGLGDTLEKTLGGVEKSLTNAVGSLGNTVEQTVGGLSKAVEGATDGLSQTEKTDGTIGETGEQQN